MSKLVLILGVWAFLQGTPSFAGEVQLNKVPTSKLLQVAAGGGPWVVTHMVCASTGVDVIGENNRIGSVSLEVGLDYLTETIKLSSGTMTSTYKIAESIIGEDRDLWDEPPRTMVENFIAQVSFKKADPVVKCTGDCKAADRLQTIMRDGLSGIDFHYYRPAYDSTDKEERLVLITKTLNIKFNVPGFNCNESDVVVTTLRRDQAKQKK
jgi:hypothetical protein